MGYLMTRRVVRVRNKQREVDDRNAGSGYSVLDEEIHDRGLELNASLV